MVTTLSYSLAKAYSSIYISLRTTALFRSAKRGETTPQKNKTAIYCSYFTISRADFARKSRAKVRDGAIKFLGMTRQDLQAILVVLAKGLTQSGQKFCAAACAFALLLKNRQRPILPGRFQPSTFGAKRLNFCVRNGNRWIPLAIVTGMVKCVCTLTTTQHSPYTLFFF